MSTKVRLSIVELDDPVLEKKIPTYGKIWEIEDLSEITNPEITNLWIRNLIRLMAWVMFRNANEWTKPQRAMVDTGAPTSLIPLRTWEDMDVEPITTHEIKGINPKEECSIPVNVGKVKCSLLDRDDNITKELNIFAFLALTDEVPLIIGFKNLLSEFKVSFDYREKEAFIEER